MKLLHYTSFCCKFRTSFKIFFVNIDFNATTFLTISFKFIYSSPGRKLRKRWRGGLHNPAYIRDSNAASLCCQCSLEGLRKRHLWQAASDSSSDLVYWRIRWHASIRSLSWRRGRPGWRKFFFSTTASTDLKKTNFSQLTEDEVIELYQRLLWSQQNTVVTKQYTLLSLTKLSTRFQKGNE